VIGRDLRVETHGALGADDAARLRHVDGRCRARGQEEQKQHDTAESHEEPNVTGPREYAATLLPAAALIGAGERVARLSR
jgi:hypothetical protein